MDIVSVDEIVVPDASVQDNANTSYENEALEIQTGDEITHGHKLIGSQSSIEYDKSGDSKRRGTGPRSKSFLEEPSRSKAALFMQRKPGGKGLRSTHGSHGDGICLWPSWDISKGITGSESTDKGPDQDKKLQIVLTDPATQSGGVTQKLFETNVTFADLVRVYTTQENNIQNCKFQLGNTLLSTVHASTLVSNYLNTYRSYLDYLRKTCGRGNSHEKLNSPRAPPKSVPLFLPLAGMTSVFSDDSREDPEFLELLKKTTTESIRKLWPHSNKSNIVQNVSLIDTRDNEDEAATSVIENINDRQTDSASTETYIDSSLQQFVDTANCETINYSNEKTQISNCENLKLSQYSYVCDNHLTLQEDSNISTNNPNYTMKFTADTVLIGDGDSANVQSMNSTQIQKGLLKVPNDTQTSVNSLYKHTTESLNQQTGSSCLSNWSDLSQQKCTGDSNVQLQRPATLDTLLQQQQKLSQQQQLQRQMLQHQQELQQQRQQQQLLQQYQQQEHQRQQSKQLPTSKSHGFQSSSDIPKGWLQAVGDGSGLNSYRTCLSINSQPTSSYKTEPLMSHQMGLDSYGNSYQMNADYFASHTGQSMTTRPTHMDSQPNNFPETSTPTRTLKASYACLDPSNPMTLSVDPLHDYSNETDAFLNQCDLPLYDRQSFPTLPSSFGPSFDDRGNYSESSRMWNKISRPITSFNDGENSGKSLEERLRKAYARSRVSQFPQQGQWNETSRLSIQRPIVKMSTMADNVDDSQSYTFQGQRGLTDSSSRRVSSSVINSAGPQDRWNRLVCCPETLDPTGNEGLISNSSGLPDDEGVNFMPLQSSTSIDHNSGMSRLYQWKQDTLPSNKASFFPGSRSPNDITGFSTNDNVAHSLLYGLQLDRDFSWNASSMSSQLPSIPVQNSFFQCSDHQTLVSDSGQSKLSVSNLSKLNALTTDQRRQLSNNNNASVLHRIQNEQMNESNLFYDIGEMKHNTWSLKNNQDDSDNHGVSGISTLGCGPVLSPSMHILNKKILAAQGNSKSLGTSGSDGDSPNGKDGEKAQSGTSTPSSIDSQSTDNRSRLRLSRGFSEANNMLSSMSMSQLTTMKQQQQGRETVDNSVFKLSEELEKTFLDDPPNATPWHELASQETLDNDYSISDTKNDKDKYGKLQNFNTTSMILNDQDLGDLHSNDTNRMYDGHQKLKDQGLQSALGNHLTNSQMCLNQQGPSPPRMILGAKSVKQVNDDKLKADVEESNRRLRQMLGLAPNKDQCNNVNASGIRLQESSQMPPQTPSPGLMLMDQTSGPYNQNNSPVATGQLPRMQVASGKIQTPVGLAQQMYCVPNILMPPPSVQSSRQSNIIPIQGVVASGTRFPQGMIRVPFVDMSRLVYVHQMPVSMTSSHPNNNNHNNSSSSNPHVNTSNIITINTSDNDFSAGGQGDKSARHIRSTHGKNKTTFLKMRSGSDEFAVPILGIRPPLDENVCPRLVKSRTNPWDQDLDHDFSNSLMSKTGSVENMSGSCTSSSTTDPNFGNPELGLLYSDVTNLHGGSQSNLEQTAKTATFMQWPASADMHPEMLDMLPIRRAIPEDCASGRLCWPEMEFLMSSREQLQTARRSNKPMGSNKANLISIIPKENITEGNIGVKETRYEKLESKLI